MENPESTSEESPAQKQIRLRRERREAKIKAGGSARLDKITSLTGRPPPAAAAASPSVQSSMYNPPHPLPTQFFFHLNSGCFGAPPLPVREKNYIYPHALTWRRV